MMINPKHFSGPAKSTHYFVINDKDSVFVTDFTYKFPVIGGVFDTA